MQYQIDVTDTLKEKNQLAICFRSVSQALNSFKKRPRWKTKLIERQQLRWIRTTLLGYIPGWTPPVKPIGPWKKIHLNSFEIAEIIDLDIQPRLNKTDGLIHCKVKLNCLTSYACEVTLIINNTRKILYSGSPKENTISIDEEVLIPQIKPWMPHTHGKPALYEYSLVLEADGKQQLLQKRNIGFRNISLNNDNKLFQLKINEQPIFARGAVWTINNIVSLNGTYENLRSALQLAHNAGMNMLRVSGTMVYEQDEFYDLCDQLGIMIWQDFMFANMDYPVTDESFHTNILAEAACQLKRLQSHPCVVIYCGNSEVEQQTAMLGIPADLWRNTWFGAELPELINTLHKNTVYVPSTPSGGILPFYTSTGVTHYYGIGAYLRDINDVRRSDVKFTAECLGFSNIPENKTIAKLMGNSPPVMHHPSWKNSIPRDSGAGWDFEDVRDHYLAELFDVDPVQLRSLDIDRYLTLSRIASSEMMSQVFSEWRSTNSNCNGGLVWFYKDLLPGAGWGILDSDNNPKAAYYYLKRIFQPVGLVLTDEGLQGLQIHLLNENPAAFTGTVEFSMVQNGNINLAKVGKEITIPANGKILLSAEDLLGGFYDTSYAYRFGPPKHEVSCATLKDHNGKIISQQFHFPLKKAFPYITANLEIDVISLEDGSRQLSIHSDHFLYTVQIECEGFLPEDNYFHLMPNESKQIKLTSVENLENPSQKLQIHVRSANLQDTIIPIVRG